jgi:hypothetical protein
MNSPSYNPFNDETIHLTLKRTQSNIIDERDAFNDAIKHGDSVQGFRAPKKSNNFQNGIKIRKEYMELSRYLFSPHL